MIQNEVNTFLALAPLMLPSLITTPSDEDSEISDDTALLYFNFDERLPIGMVSDMCLDGMELIQLYFGSSKTAKGVKHCCMFSRPANNKQMFKMNLASDSLGFVQGLSVTIYDSSEVMEQGLEEDLIAHSSYDFENSMTTGDVLSLFCKIR